MTENNRNTMNDRDQMAAFLAGNNGGGRKKGSRNKLAEQFIDPHDEWQKNGRNALKRVAEDEPAIYYGSLQAFCRKNSTSPLTSIPSCLPRREILPKPIGWPGSSSEPSH